MREVGEVTLRDVVADDVPVFYEFQLDPEACAMAGFPARSWDAHATHWARILDDEANFTQTVLVDGQVAGNIASFIQHGEREVGYWLGRAFWGRGIATRALALFLTHEQRRPLAGYVVKHNLASRRVLEKCGFTMTEETDDEFRLELHRRARLRPSPLRGGGWD